jgi:hypothetical protein
VHCVMPDAAVQEQGKFLQVARRSDMSQRLFCWLCMENLSESQAGIFGSHHLDSLGELRMGRSEFSVLKPKGINKTRLQHHCLD